MPDITGPRLFLQPGDGVGSGGGTQLELAGEAPEEILHEVGNILEPVAQRGQMNDEGTEAVEEVLAKPLLAHGLFEVAMRGGDDADIHGKGFLAAHPLNAPFLKHPQEFGLRERAQVPDLVEEQRAAVRLLETPDPPRFRTGERAPFMAEQFAFEQHFGDGRAIHGDERFIGARAVLIQGAGDQLLAGAGLAPNENRHRFGRHPSDFLADFLHDAAVADDGFAGGSGLAEIHWLAHQSRAGDGFGGHFEQVFHLERLDQVFERATFGRLDHRFGGAESGHEHERQSGFGGV